MTALDERPATAADDPHAYDPTSSGIPHPATPGADITAEDITNQFRAYTHTFIDRLFDHVAAQDLGHGAGSGVLAFLVGDDTTFTGYRRNLAAMMAGWGDQLYEADGPACDGRNCTTPRCLCHNQPDLCQPFPVAPELRRTFDEIRRRGIWRQLVVEGIGDFEPRYLNVLTSAVQNYEPNDYKDEPDNELTVNGGAQ